MPYYRWVGVELTGDMRKGTLFARSHEHLDRLLFKRQIALLSYKHSFQWFKKPIRLQHILQFFRQLQVLVDAGVLLPDALTIVVDQIDNPQFQEIIGSITEQIEQGVSLSSCLKSYPKVFNHIVIQLVQAGEESGNLATTLEGVCAHLEATQEFRTKLRNALMLPLVTLIFFVCILLVIFLFIMPRFVDIFMSMNQTIPPLTKTLLSISEFLTSWAFGMLVIIFVLVLYLLVRWAGTNRGSRIINTVLLKIPFIGNLLQQRFLSYVLQSLAFLLEGGVPVYEAITLIRSSVSNHVFQEQLWYLESDIAAGATLSQAMLSHPSHIFSQDTSAMVEVGEASGNLVPLLKKAAHVYHVKLTNYLSFLTMILQPTIMIFLGLLVGILIFAVYGPIFNMAHAF